MAPKPSSSVDHERRFLRFASDVAHELVGPVNQVSSLVSLFASRYRGRIDEEADSLLAHIQSAGIRVASAAEALRVYFQVVGSKPERVLVNTSAALHAALNSIELELRQCDAHVSFDSLPDIQGDANLLTLLFHSLIQNAVKFRRPDTPPRIVITAECSASGCTFSVSDNGIGIDPLYSETVFNAFTRLHGHSYPGAGMGLTLARAIAEMEGGRIWIGPSSSPGATVLFELPKASPMSSD